ncbi:MAG: T9SS type A sorting domain-containing protein [Flavobacteriales bacterium]|nr:T9SS type A sorting domain-containing protein [Flavobacteriales bacterium]MBP6698110.1 T9SS type A sorting domain-containing protein [Flavobacteriales bacterium]
MYGPHSLVLALRRVRAVLLLFAVCLEGLTACAQNTFFNNYNPGFGGSFSNVMQCTNGDFVCLDYYWDMMMRTDSLGHVLWAKHSDPSVVVRSDAPVEQANGDLLVLANQYDTATAQNYMALVRMDAMGNVLSVDAFAVDTLNFYPWRSVPLNNGMIAHIATAQNAQEVVIMVFDPSGPYAYPRIRIPVNFQLQGNAPAGFTGVFAGPNPYFYAYHGSFQPAFVLSKYTTSGAAVWSKTYEVDGSYTAIGMAGAMLANGNLVLLVEAIGQMTEGEYVLLLNPSGDVISAQKLVDPDNAFDWKGDVVPMPDGSFVVHLSRVEIDPSEGDILVHMDANAGLIAQYGTEPGTYVHDVIAVDNDRLALAGGDNGARTLSVMAFNGPLPTCWVADSVTVVPVIATASNASFTSSTYIAPPLPASITTSPSTITGTPMCGSVEAGTTIEMDAFRVFPIPAQDLLNVVLPVGGVRYQLQDATGRIVREGSFSSMHAQLELSGVRDGMYTLLLMSNDAKRVERVSVQR